MNLWECSFRGCSNRAVGTGGAAGLRAIGWWVEEWQEEGPDLLCPAHLASHLSKHVDDHTQTRLRNLEESVRLMNQELECTAHVLSLLQKWKETFPA